MRFGSRCFGLHAPPPPAPRAVARRLLLLAAAPTAPHLSASSVAQMLAGQSAAQPATCAAEPPLPPAEPALLPSLPPLARQPDWPAAPAVASPALSGPAAPGAAWPPPPLVAAPPAPLVLPSLAPMAALDPSQPLQLAGGQGQGPYCHDRSAQQDDLCDLPSRDHFHLLLATYCLAAIGLDGDPYRCPFPCPFPCLRRGHQPPAPRYSGSYALQGQAPSLAHPACHPRLNPKRILVVLPGHAGSNPPARQHASAAAAASLVARCWHASAPPAAWSTGRSHFHCQTLLLLFLWIACPTIQRPSHCEHASPRLLPHRHALHLQPRRRALPPACPSR